MCGVCVCVSEWVSSVVTKKRRAENFCHSHQKQFFRSFAQFILVQHLSGSVFSPYIRISMKMFQIYFFCYFFVCSFRFYIFASFFHCCYFPRLSLKTDLFLCQLEVFFSQSPAGARVNVWGFVFIFALVSSSSCVAHFSSGLKHLHFAI